MTVKSIDAATLKSWLDHDEAILIDVRESAEHAAEHIAGAHLAPLSQLKSLDAHAGGDRFLVVHCLKGGRGQTACDILQKAHPDKNIYNLAGGITSWRDAGFPTVRTQSARRLPLDRQVQLTIGLLLLTACLLAVFVHPAFLWLIALIGTGLTIAGLTGFCGLAIMMAKMPWNRHIAGRAPA